MMSSQGTSQSQNLCHYYLLFFKIFFCFHFFKQFPFVGPLIPLLQSPFGFKARMDSLIHTWQRCI